MVVHGKVQGVPDRYELAARMKYIEGKTWAQVGRSLSLSRGALDNLKRKMRRDMEKTIRIMLIMRE